MASTSDPLADRRQQAREAYYDTFTSDIGELGGERRKASVRACIEVATQVKITDDIIDAAYGEVPWAPTERSDMPDIIKAAFEAAGFEVVE